MKIKTKQATEKAIALFLSILLIVSVLSFTLPMQKVSAKDPEAACKKHNQDWNCICPMKSESPGNPLAWTDEQCKKSPLCVTELCTDASVKGFYCCDPKARAEDPVGKIEPPKPKGPVSCVVEISSGYEGNKVPPGAPITAILKVHNGYPPRRAYICYLNTANKAEFAIEGGRGWINYASFFTTVTLTASEKSGEQRTHYVICGIYDIIGEQGTKVKESPIETCKDSFDIVKPEEAKEIPTPGAWWKVPCLRFKEPSPELDKGWGPFTSWVDWTWTIISATYALAFTIGLDEEGRCVPEQPLDDDACDKCEEDPYRICTKERCEILGHNCYAIEKDDGNGYHCFKGECDVSDAQLAQIEKIDFKWYLGLASDLGGSDSVNGNQLVVDDKLPWNVTHALLSIEQNKEAKCRYALDIFEADFDDMNNFDDSELYPKNQSVSLDLTEISSGEHYIFIKCKNKCGTENVAEDDNNYVKFEIDEIPEGIPPIIEYIDPESGYISNALTTVDVEFWLNENLLDSDSCRYSTFTNNLTLDWADMIPIKGPHGNGENAVVSGTCVNDKECRYTETGDCAHCSLELDMEKGFKDLDADEIIENLEEEGIENEVTAEELGELIGTKKSRMYLFMIRCQDENGNKNDGDDYGLVAIPPFNTIIEIPPEGNRTYEREIEIEVNTSYEDLPRATYCRYKVLEGHQTPKLPWSDLEEIDDMLTDYHYGITKELEPGQYTLYAKCRDLARIQDDDANYFTILEDTTASEVIRMYHDTASGDYLIIETDEEAECVYSTRDCDYNFSDGVLFSTTGESYLHAAYWQLDDLYYIKCKDRWDNYPGVSSNANVCTVKIDPYQVPGF